MLGILKFNYTKTQKGFSTIRTQHVNTITNYSNARKNVAYKLEFK